MLLVELCVPALSKNLVVFRDVGGQGWRVGGGWVGVSVDVGELIWHLRDCVFHYAALSPTQCPLPGSEGHHFYDTQTLLRQQQNQRMI